MDDKTNPPVTSPPTAAPQDISFVRGGPFYRIQRAFGLIRPGQWNLGRRIAVFIAVGWLPLFVITAILNPRGLDSLIRDYRVHSRMLIAVPALLIAEYLMELRFSMVMRHIRDAGLLDGADLALVDVTIATLVRIRDSFLPELTVILILVLHTVISYKGLVDATPWLASGSAPDIHLTAAGRYAVLISVSIFQFLLGLALWKWLLWTFFAFKLSRRNLKLIPTHPDGHGGLGFLGLTASAFAPVAFAATAVIAATWRQEILHHRAHLMDFKFPTIALLVIVVLVAFGPLVFFVPRLSALRRKAILEYGILGQIHSSEFHEKWILHRVGHESEFLQAPDSSTLTDYGTSYEKIEQLQPFLADKGALYTLAASVAIPALPAIVAEIPIVVVLRDLLKALR
jgi:hypothetical protein